MSQIPEEDLSFLEKIYGKSEIFFKKNFSSHSLSFLLKYLREPEKVGAIAPSSVHLGRAMLAYITAEGENRHLLEVGPGTGPFTSLLSERLHATDQLDLVELDRDFVQILSDQYSEKKGVKVIEGSIVDWSPPYRYDAIISSLPFNLFPFDVVVRILNKFEEICRPGGTVSYFQYLGISEVKKIFLSGEQLEEYQKTLNALHLFQEKYEMAQETIWSNMPPAVVHHCRL